MLIEGLKVVRLSRYSDFAGNGSGFCMDYEGRQILITARHVVYDSENKLQRQVYIDQGESVSFQITDSIEPGGDIIGLYLDRHVDVESMEIAPRFYDSNYGEEIYCLGFPYIFPEPYRSPNSGWPLPVIKKGIISYIGIESFHIDCMAVQGMSGGPVIMKHPDEYFEVIGIVSNGGAYHLYDSRNKELMSQYYVKSQSDTVECLPMSLLVEELLAH